MCCLLPGSPICHVYSMSPWLGTVLRNRKRLLTIKCPNCWAVVWRVRRVLCPCSAWALEHCDDPKVDASFIPKARKPSLIAPTFSDPSFKSVSYLTRNEQSVVTSFFFFSKLMQFRAYGIYLPSRSAAEHNFNYTCHPRPH